MLAFSLGVSSASAAPPNNDYAATALNILPAGEYLGASRPCR